MRKFDTKVQHLKYKVLREVARLAWEDKLLDNIMNIPTKLSGIVEADIPEMAAHAEREANPLYPVPKLMTKEELKQFYYKVADWGKV